LERGAGVAEILADLRADLEAFSELRKPYLLYPE
jgi:hypothetical protein